MEASPHTIARLIQQAERFISFQDWDQASVRCYRILALDPHHAGACEKLRQIYSDPELVEALQRAIHRLFAESAASPHQQRRKLAFSYRVLSRWPGWQKDVEQIPPVQALEEVAQMLDHAYVTGEEDDLLTAWERFEQASAADPAGHYAVQWWMAKQYALHGYFADAAEVLTEMLAEDPTDPNGRYVLAEMRWWRDQAETLAWIN